MTGPLPRRRLAPRQAQAVYVLFHAGRPLDATQVADAVQARLGWQCTRTQARQAMERLRVPTAPSRTRAPRPALVTRRWHMGTWQYSLTLHGRAWVPG